MSVIIILLLASIAVASIFLIYFLLSARKGRFDDEKVPDKRFDDQPSLPTTHTLEPVNPLK